MEEKKYYEAYEDRYRQVHEKSLKWFSDSPSGIVEQTMEAFGIGTHSKILEIGCGEGRDAVYLLRKGFSVHATDISPTVISHCKEWYPDFSDSFAVFDCLSQPLPTSYDFIYAIAVLHMLVLDEDRARFYESIRRQLSSDGVALICSMGDGAEEWQTNVNTAFDLQKRTHEATGEELMIAATSCRVVSSQTFAEEIAEHHLTLIESGVTSILPDFPMILYAVVQKAVGFD